jgi:hypothetical protein
MTLRRPYRRAKTDSFGVDEFGPRGRLDLRVPGSAKPTASQQEAKRMIMSDARRQDASTARLR